MHILLYICFVLHLFPVYYIDTSEPFPVTVEEHSCMINMAFFPFPLSLNNFDTLSSVGAVAPRIYCRWERLNVLQPVLRQSRPWRLLYRKLRRENRVWWRLSSKCSVLFFFFFSTRICWFFLRITNNYSYLCLARLMSWPLFFFCECSSTHGQAIPVTEKTGS